MAEIADPTIEELVTSNSGLEEVQAKGREAKTPSRAPRSGGLERFLTNAALLTVLLAGACNLTKTERPLPKKSTPTLPDKSPYGTVNSALSAESAKHLGAAKALACAEPGDTSANYGQFLVEGGVGIKELVLFGNQFKSFGEYLECNAPGCVEDPTIRKKILGLSEGTGVYQSIAVFPDKTGQMKLVFLRGNIYAMNASFNADNNLQVDGQEEELKTKGGLSIGGQTFSYVEIDGIPHLITLGNTPYLFNLHTNEVTDITLANPDFITDACGMPTILSDGTMLLSFESTSGGKVKCRMATPNPNDVISTTKAVSIDGITILIPNKLASHLRAAKGPKIGDVILAQVDTFNLDTGNMEPLQIVFTADEYCGDGECNAPKGTQETTETCPADCPPAGPVCGDGTCDAPTETPDNCEKDCPKPGPVCGDQVCDQTEDSTSCPSDCPPLPVEDAGTAADTADQPDPGTPPEDTPIIIADSDDAGVDDIPPPTDVQEGDTEAPIDVPPTPDTQSETDIQETTPPPDTTSVECKTVGKYFKLSTPDSPCTVTVCPADFKVDDEIIPGEQAEFSGPDGATCVANFFVDWKGLDTPTPGTITVTQMDSGKAHAICKLYSGDNPQCEQDPRMDMEIVEDGENMEITNEKTGTVTALAGSKVRQKALNADELLLQAAQHDTTVRVTKDGYIFKIPAGPNGEYGTTWYHIKISEEGEPTPIEVIPPVPEGTPQADIPIQTDISPNADASGSEEATSGAENSSADTSGADATQTPAPAPGGGGGCAAAESPNEAPSKPIPAPVLLALIGLLTAMIRRRENLREQNRPAFEQAELRLAAKKALNRQ